MNKEMSGKQESTDLLARSVLIENIKKLLSTFSNGCFHISPPVRLITVCCDASIGQEPWQEIAKPHDLYRRLVCCSSSIAGLGRFCNLVTSRSKIGSRQKPRLFLLHSRTLLLNPCVVLVGAQTLNCNNAERLVSLQLYIPARKYNSSSAYSTLDPLSSGSPSNQMFRPVSMAVSLLHSTMMRF